ncbi:Uncharacterised protein [Bordetella pertussis]|nr:Uncharacterised protein [Bordetella pertussis]CFO34994.1 Uncharacterised protein [Bordetella pertussis]CFP08304.1 Uncharacterised protein [Bordetella pertussis]CFU05170.1 Uncharacterised protein [Bordetella pertussis]CFW12549.1 Uncharacterised protein [Bordetella pertussis]
MVWLCATTSRSSWYRSVIQPSACGGGVMLSPLEQNTMMGERMLRRSMRMPSEVTSPAVARRLPTNRLSTMYWISGPLRNTCPPHHFSNSR